jgi:hypothetical protein
MRLCGLSTRRPTAVTGRLPSIEGLGRANVANGLFVRIVDHAPESALRAHLPILGVPRASAVRRFAGEGAYIFAARKERDGPEADRGSRIVFGLRGSSIPEGLELYARHFFRPRRPRNRHQTFGWLVGLAQAATDRQLRRIGPETVRCGFC